MSYTSFGDASAAAIRFENTRRSRGFDTPGQGPAKRSNSASESGPQMVVDRVAATAVGLLLTLEGTVLGVGSGGLALEDSDLVSTRWWSVF